MFENITAGWKMGSAIRKLVLQDRQLLVYPIISGIVIFLEMLAIIVPLIIFNALNSLLFIVALFVYYIVVYFTATYVLVAMLLAFRAYEDGKMIGIVEALSQTSQYTLLIFEWAVFEAVITMIIRAIEQRLGALGGAIFGIVAGMAVGIATLFAIPVIIDKKTGPIQTVKASAGFIFKNFGKAFGGLLFTELYSLIFVAIGIVLLFVALLSLAVSVLLAAVIGVIALLFLVYGAMLGYMLNNIYKFILYDVSNGGKLPKGITQDMIDASVKKKNPQGGLGGMLGGFGGNGQ